MPYTRNRPLASDFLSSSQPILLNNINSSDDSFGVDHYQFSDTSANNGRHKIIHQTTLNPAGLDRTRSGPGATTANFPGTIANIQQTFAAKYTPDATVTTTDTQLFSFTGNGGLSQLTGNLASTDGWCWMGGILFQWGIVTTSSSSGTVTFKDRVPGAIPFPNNIFVVNTSAFYAGGAITGSTTYYVVKNGSPNPKTVDFDWARGLSSGSPTPTGFFWQAIGN